MSSNKQRIIDKISITSTKISNFNHINIIIHIMIFVDICTGSNPINSDLVLVYPITGELYHIY